MRPHPRARSTAARLPANAAAPKRRNADCGRDGRLGRRREPAARAVPPPPATGAVA
ncbi:MAG: hypothetical protein AVDCRST_MAG19-4081 [uncultured Thermomicrobiales bacterium]|uniref:Uncharacterized protein n=1 Tax=uncultured Thermomicrobiales bacterium TaxID=1645740 RepID=A0A6J4VP40_9BACT|nr:MAG: hypothetical protein AVDCRST_MAG19-4081 [uncultured Thermomicrobiales bacterium]